MVCACYCSWLPASNGNQFYRLACTCLERVFLSCWRHNCHQSSMYFNFFEFEHSFFYFEHCSSQHACGAADVRQHKLLLQPCVLVYRDRHEPYTLSSMVYVQWDQHMIFCCGFRAQTQSLQLHPFVFVFLCIYTFFSPPVMTTTATTPVSGFPGNPGENPDENPVRTL